MERRLCNKNVPGIEQCPLKVEIRRDHFKINMMNHRKARILKTTSLVTLTLQNSILGLSLRYARTRPGDLFLSTTAVFMSEIVKLAICLIILLFEEGSVRQLLTTLDNVVIKQPIDTLKVCVPSFVYIIQNNLLFISASHLDAATYQVTYQLKILTTAVFAVLMLKRTLPLQQWVALVVLVLGVVLVQLTGSSDNTKNTEIVQNKLIGFSSALTACVLSGFAGIYFEMILKGSDISVWMRNVQLSFLSLPFGLVTCFVKDWEKITKNGFFHSYDSFVVFVVFLQAGGGLIVAMVVKYADNILKGFATSLAIILSCIASVYLFDFVITVQFIIGAGLVIASIFLYNVKPTTKTKIPRESADMTESMNVQRV